MTKYSSNDSRMGKHASRKKWVALPVAVLLLGVLAFFGLEKAGITHFYGAADVDEATEQAPAPVSSIDYSPAKTTDNDDIESKKETGAITEQPPAPTNDTAIQITYIANGQDEEKGPLLIRTLLGGVGEGTCTITLTRDDVTKTKETNVVQQNNTFSCNFDIAYDELSQGEWNINLLVKTQDGRQNNASANTTIR